MISIKEKIEHLEKIGFTGNMTELEKMYSGQEFDLNDSNYQKLIALSEKYCARFTELASLISMTDSLEEKEMYTKERNEILDILFPGHGPLFGGGDGLQAVIGTVDLGSFNYLNARVHFNHSSLVQLDDYVFVASNVEFGTNKETSKLGKIHIGNDTWIGANVTIEDDALVGARSVIGTGSHIALKSMLKDDYISFGNPCCEYKRITDDYETIIKTPPQEAIRTKEEIEKVIAHIRNLGINGDFTQFIKSLNYEKYNTLEPTCARIFDLSHSLCSEYNSQNISIRRRKDILDMLFPLQGSNLTMGEDIYVDGIGTVKIGDNVTIGNHSSLAGNVTIGDNVVIKDNVTLQTIGHEINYQGRKLTQDEFGNICEISVPAYIVVKPSIVLADGTIVIPNQTVRNNTEVDEVVKKSR